VIFEDGDEGWHRLDGSRPDPPQRGDDARPEKEVVVFEGVDEGWHRLDGGRPAVPQRVGGAPPDRYVRVFEGVDEVGTMMLSSISFRPPTEATTNGALSGVTWARTRNSSGTSQPSTKGVIAGSAARSGTATSCERWVCVRLPD